MLFLHTSFYTYFLISIKNTKNGNYFLCNLCKLLICKNYNVIISLENNL